MVRTRSKSMFIERLDQARNQDEISREIKERAENRQSPRKLSVLKQEQKAKKDSNKIAKLLSNVKKNLSKVQLNFF